MAVEKSNNMFDWCDKIARAKTNYSDAECLEILKKRVAEIGGIDQGFYNKVSSSTMKDVTFDNRFAPVYLLTIKATYIYSDVETDGDVTTTTTHTDTYTFNKSTTKNFFDSLNMGEFVGRNDNRLFTLTHVDDLPNSLYGNKYCYSSYEMDDRVYELAAPRHIGTCTVNGYECMAVLVPVVCIYVDYNGTRYYCVVNKHNGCSYLYYPASQKVTEGAKRAYAAYMAFKILGFACAGITLVLSIIEIFTAGLLNGILSVVLFGGANAIVIWRMSEHDVFDRNKQFYMNTYGRSGKIRMRYNFPIMLFFILTFVIMLVLIFAVALQ